jgi:hypothetical protein
MNVDWDGFTCDDCYSGTYGGVAHFQTDDDDVTFDCTNSCRFTNVNGDTDGGTINVWA